MTNLDYAKVEKVLVGWLQERIRRWGLLEQWWA